MRVPWICGVCRYPNPKDEEAGGHLCKGCGTSAYTLASSLDWQLDQAKREREGRPRR